MASLPPDLGQQTDPRFQRTSADPAAQQSGMAGAAQTARRMAHTPETKPFYRTSEFLSSMIASLGVLISAAVSDNFQADEAWPLVAFLSIGYMISRGLAKTGIRHSDGGGERF